MVSLSSKNRKELKGLDCHNRFSTILIDLHKRRTLYKDIGKELLLNFKAKLFEFVLFLIIVYSLNVIFKHC